MRIGIASDHGGFALKAEIAAMLRLAGHQLLDFGAHALNPADDYPDFVIPLARAMAAGEIERGVALCGSGVGASIAANKIAGVRAGLIHDVFSARQGVEDKGSRRAGGNATACRGSRGTRNGSTARRGGRAAIRPHRAVVGVRAGEGRGHVDNAAALTTCPQRQKQTKPLLALPQKSGAASGQNLTLGTPRETAEIGSKQSYASTAANVSLGVERTLTTVPADFAFTHSLDLAFANSMKGCLMTG
jgi:hypothetical protein